MNFFPNIYPDEILYSILARYHHLSGNLKVEKTMFDLYGVKCTQILDFPKITDRLVKNIPGKNNYSEQNFIRNHSLLPYFLPFLTPKSKQQVLQMMASNTRYHLIHSQVGYIAKSSISNHLKYCTSCLIEDLNKNGESYWRRTHQAPGNFYCLDHQRILSTGCEACGFHFNTKLRNKLFILKQFCPNCGSDLTLQNQSWSPLLSEYKTELIEISNEINYLFIQQDIWLDELFPKLHNLYVMKLIEANFYEFSNKLRLRKLIYFFEKFYSRSLLKLLGCDAEIGGWLRECIDGEYARHPLKHILLIKFLFGSLNGFKLQQTSLNLNTIQNGSRLSSSEIKIAA
ncbi:TnsD family Tn7-like transposition protein [Paenibacillus sp. LjRoot153]|uniref:TniQ family protein n=1 Tax=Paenibacillus sp. LjRoot153 TaxID=3342270 RepID=UPI003ECD9C0A